MGGDVTNNQRIFSKGRDDHTLHIKKENPGQSKLAGVLARVRGGEGLLCLILSDHEAARTNDFADPDTGESHLLTLVANGDGISRLDFSG